MKMWSVKFAEGTIDSHVFTSQFWQRCELKTSPRHPFPHTSIDTLTFSGAQPYGHWAAATAELADTLPIQALAQACHTFWLVFAQVLYSL